MDRIVGFVGRLVIRVHPLYLTRPPMFLAYYDSCWRVRLPDKSGRYHAPAVMEAGIVKNLWSFERLYDEVTAA